MRRVDHASVDHDGNLIIEESGRTHLLCRREERKPEDWRELYGCTASLFLCANGLVASCVRGVPVAVRQHLDTGEYAATLSKTVEFQFHAGFPTLYCNAVLCMIFNDADEPLLDRVFPVFEFQKPLLMQPGIAFTLRPID